MRREPTAIALTRVGTVRIGLRPPEGSRQPAKVIDDRLDARMTLDSTNIPQMSESSSPNRVRSGVVGPPHLQESEDPALQSAQLRGEDHGGAAAR